MNTFDDILPYWTNELWVGRVSKIEHMSSLKWNSYLWFVHGNVEITKDHSIFDKYGCSLDLVSELDTGTTIIILLLIPELHHHTTLDH